MSTLTNSPFCDGYIYHAGSTGWDWADPHDATSGTVILTGDTIFVGYHNSGASTYYYTIDRGFLSFLLNIGSGATISAVALSLYVHSHTGVNYGFNVYEGTQASDTTLASGDFDACGTTYYATAPTITDSQYCVWNFNATGIAAINKTGYTKLSLRQGSNDVADVDPSSAIAANTVIHSSRSAGTSEDPYITITYTAGSYPMPCGIV
jgi:hypothetical protein